MPAPARQNSLKVVQKPLCPRRVGPSQSGGQCTLLAQKRTPIGKGKGGDVSASSIVVSLVGRPNVGKSSLFNRLMGRSHQIITYNRPGVTRDRHYGIIRLGECAEIPDREIILIDTGGFYPVSSNQDDASPFFSSISEHISLAIEESDLVLLVTDARAGLLPLDQNIADMIRSHHKPFWPLANKCDSEKQEGMEAPFFALGAESLFAVSASHDRGISHLRFELHRFAYSTGKTATSEPDCAGKVALIGTPNSGKSTLLNQLLGTSRALVSHIPGTTLDPVEGVFELDFGENATLFGEGDSPWRRIKILDTAGIRKKPLVRDAVEAQSVFRSLRCITESDMVLFLIDAEKGVGHQDRRLLDISLDKGKAVVIVLNKMDVVKFDKNPKGRSEWWEDIKANIPWSNFCDLVPISAKYGKGLGGLRRAMVKTLSIRHRKLPTAKLNSVLEKLLERNPVRIKGGGNKPFKIKYASMVKNAPPTFLLFSNRQQNIPEHYKRYLKNGLRRAFALDNTPIHLIFRSS